MIGRTLSHFKITAKLGEGGMGEVYRAEDLKLGREVAIKVLPSEFTEHPERLARFEREAKLISSLNHPHICTLHEIGSQNGTHFLVMELIEGESLAERLVGGALPLEQVVRYGRQIAEALGEAHRRGIVHRDLKPGNIMLTRSGAKLLDFGLARSGVEDRPPEGFTQTPTEAPLTEAGAVLGTFQYMSPEQLEGREIDARADIFALGCVLYEMTTGHKAFTGSSQAGLISAIMTSEPTPVREVQPFSPELLDRLIGKCLAKDPDSRWHSALDCAAALTWIASEDRQVAPTAAMPESRRVPWHWVSAGLAIGVVATGVGLGFMKQPKEPSKPTRFVMELPADHELVVQAFAGAIPPSNPLALSPDGRRLVYAASIGGGPSMLFLRELDQLEITTIPGTEGARDPFFSPDSEWIGYRTGDEIRKIPLGGGPSMLIASGQERGNVADWGRDDHIVFETAGAELKRVSAGGGPVGPVATATGAPHIGPQILPDGYGVLFSGWRSGWKLARVTTPGEEPVFFDVPGQVQWARYLPTRHLVYRTADALMAAPFDLEQLRLQREPVAVLEDVVTYLSYSENGTLAYLAQENPLGRRTLVWVDRRGRESPILEADINFHFPRVAPDGTRIAFDAVRAGAIWVLETERGTRTRLPSNGIAALTTWSSAGTGITFAAGPTDEDIHRMPIEGGAEPELLLAREHAQWPTSWSAGDDFLLFTETHPETGRDIWFLPMAAERREPVPFLVTPADEGAAKFSPDGRWVVFRSDESGQHEIYVTSFPDANRKIAISTAGGSEPVWSPDGTELFYRSGDSMMVVDTTIGAEFVVGRPRELFRGQHLSDPIGHPLYDIHPDGDRFLMVRQDEAPSPPRIKVVLDWFDELERLAPTDR